jgi:diguanylate cyclase (GGDEF)-like protein
MVGLRIPINGSTSVADCYATGEPAWIDQVTGDPRMNVQLISEVEAELGVRMGSAVHYPIISGGQCLGVLAIACPIGVPTPRTHEDALELMAGEIALALSHHNLLLELQRLSAVDPLTGVANRRSWEIQIERELSRAYRDHLPLCVLMIDLDHFKRYNDLYGHHAGDDVLRSVTQSWHRRLRPSDLLCRWGGEEFAVLLPNCTLPGAHRVAEDLRTTMPPNITCSIGIAEWDHHESHFTLTHRADQHLYTAKSTGRDRVCAAAP